MIDWNKEFPITSITRADLKQAGFTDAQIQTLEDADLQEIAAMMADIYLDNGYCVSIGFLKQTKKTAAIAAILFACVPSNFQREKKHELHLPQQQIR